MKRIKFYRLLGLIAILSVLMAAIPATALAATTLTLNPAQAKVGDTVGYTTSGYGTSANDYYIDVYISDQLAASGSINSTITRYKRVRYGDGPLDNGDSFTGSFVVPATINEGSLGATTPHTVTGGGTYYIYTTVRYSYSQAQNPPTLISAYAALTISPSASLDALNPATGPAGTTVSISGGNFPASTALVFQLDSTTIVPTSGDTITRSSGIFISTITIPAGTAAGSHNITVTAGSSSATRTFTVTSSPTLNALLPATGAPGTTVAVSGSNFLPSYPIIFKFDSETRTPTGGDSNTTTSGTFASTITVPATATAGAHKIYVTVSTATVEASFTVTAATTNPAINLSATSGAAGSDVTIGGTDFPDGNITITIDGTGLAIKSGSTQASGGVFSSVVTVPSGTSAGAHTIAATVGSTTVSAQFTVTPPSTTTPPSSKAVLSINQSGHAVGSIIGIGGAGFTASTNVTVKYDDQLVSSIKTDAQGTFVLTFDAPASKAGDHVITVSDGVNSAKTTFTVESTAPKVPPPLKPELGAKVKSPVVFDWQEVTDDSRPVTYRLQVATDKSFASSMVVLDRAGIEGSSYTLSEIEELKLAEKDTAYYWRVKAVDAASNESEWTGAGEFYVSGPFKFPTWGIYTAVGVGAVVFFLLGLWVGRRTAFYY
jgi:hypothetical protein